METSLFFLPQNEHWISFMIENLMEQAPASFDKDKA
jgi:hypothetical protein